MPLTGKLFGTASESSVIYYEEETYGPILGTVYLILWIKYAVPWIRLNLGGIGIYRNQYD